MKEYTPRQRHFSNVASNVSFDLSRYKYPNLCSLYDAEKVEEFYRKGFTDELQTIEEELRIIIEADDKGEFSIEKFSDSIVAKWYDGKLDSCYTIKRNNELFSKFFSFLRFTKEFKVGDTVYYDVDEFDSPKHTEEAIVDEVTSEYVVLKTKDCNEMFDYDIIDCREFRKGA